MAGYYGSDSAGTFATCVGVLNGLVAAGQLEYKPAAYMPVMLAVMEIPGCLVALYLVSRLRARRDGRPGPHARRGGLRSQRGRPGRRRERGNGHHGSHSHASRIADELGEPKKPPGIFSPELLHEVFLNPGLFLLFGGIIIGFVGQKQGSKVVEVDDPVFLNLFQGLLCLFLLEMGMTASRKLKDLKRGGVPFIILGIAMPIVFSTIGISVAHVFSMVIHQELSLGTYVLFSVLCGAASYIAVPGGPAAGDPRGEPDAPAGRLARPDLLLQRDDRIPLYIEIAKALMKAFPAV